MIQSEPKPQILKHINHLRAVKSQLEVFYIKQGADVLAEVFYRVKEYLEPGLTELEVGRFIERQMASIGVRAVPFTPIVATGKGAADIHHWPTEAKIKEGDMVMVDMGVMVKDYCSDMTRTLFLGQPSKKQTRLYEAVLKSQEAGLRKVKAGTTGAQVDDAIRKVLKKAQLNNKFTHNAGHGVGRFIHEWPRLGVKSDDVLQAGMVVTVEPGIYIKGWGGVRIEDMVRVMSSGCEILTTTPKDLESVIVSV